MSNNYWNQQPDNKNDSHNNGSSRSGSQIRHYSDQTVQAPSQYSPLMSQTPQGAPPPPSQYSPIPPVNTPQQQEWPGAQAWPTPSFFGNAMQTVRRWTGKMAATRGGNVDQDPLVLYRPATPPPVQAPRSKPWKRSHSVRVAMLMHQRRERLKQSRPKGHRIAIIAATIFALLLVIALSSGAAAGYAYYDSQLPRLQGLANQQINQSTRIYDRNGNLLYVAYDNKTGTGNGRSTPVTYNYIPGVMQDAMIAAEDHTFWDNSGIDPQGILRAATQYSSSGTVQSGGSTITQQVIKNLNENYTHQVAQTTLQRKIPEAALAIGLTQQYPKWKILEMYLNISPFGAQELGADAAAEDYFDLHAKCDAHFNCIPAVAFLDRDLAKCKNRNDESTCKEDPLLGLARASLLAGMPQNPVSYDPTLGSANKVLALARQDYVLQQMLALNMHINTALGDRTIDNGLITPAIIQQVEAMTANTKKMPFTGFHAIQKDQHFVDWIIPQVETALGNGDADKGVYPFLTGGFNIRTTIDSSLQTYVENAAKRHIQQPEFQPFTGIDGPLNQTNNLHDSAVVVMNAKTGEVLAMNGSTNWNDPNKEVDGQFNAALAARSPGSSFKPIVLAAAMEMGWYEGIVLPDKKTYFPNGSSSSLTSAYVPTDYGGNATNKVYHNTNYNIRWNIANSFNIPALKTAYFAGPANVYTMAQRLGITAFTTEQANAASAGIGSGAATLLQMTDAYQAFANNGWRIPPHGILDIYDNYGHHLYQYDPTSKKVFGHPDGGQAISPQIAFMLTSILKDENARFPEFENDHVLSMWDQTLPDGTHPEVAAKTGTTDNFTDNWTIGYTPDVVVGVWTGNADNSPMINSIGITGAAPIWHSIIEYVSGYNNSAIDGVKYEPLDLHFSDRAFPSAPPHVIQSYVNTVNGLAGSGYFSWMLDTEVPQQSGLTTKNGNGNSTPTPTPTP